MTIRRLLLVAFILSALAASGCSSAGPYFRNRAADFADIFIAELTMGPYADVHANVTEYLGSALGFYTDIITVRVGIVTLVVCCSYCTDIHAPGPTAAY